MKRLFGTLLYAVFFACCGVGCSSSSRVLVEPRKTPEYPSQCPVRVPAASVAVYPAISAGDAVTRQMRLSGYEMLVKAMSESGYRVVTVDESSSAPLPKCIVELVECRHDMPEWNGGSASLVTVVAVRVRGPGVLRGGHMTFEGMRAFQGVFRDDLGMRPNDFAMTDDESKRGIRGAIGNLLKAAQFREAVAAIAKD